MSCDNELIRVAIFGGGSVGRAVASRLINAGVPVQFGVRDPGKTIEHFPDSPAISIRSMKDAAGEANVIVLAVPATAAVDVVGAIEHPADKVILDCTNPVMWEEGPVLSPPPAGSVAEAISVAYPSLAVVKGLNHFGAEVHADPRVTSGPVDALFAGDDDRAKAMVMHLAAKMGFQPRDAGPLRNAGLLESLAVLWIQLATVGHLGRNFSFSIAMQE